MLSEAGDVIRLFKPRFGARDARLAARAYHLSAKVVGSLFLRSTDQRKLLVNMFYLIGVRQRSLHLGGQLAEVLMRCQFHTRSRVLRPTAYALNADEGSRAVDVVENRVRLSTCGCLYREWRKTRPAYRNAPADGIEVDVDFVCSAMSADQSSFVETGRPLAVLLHGAPGSYRDFSENLTPRLLERGVDILAPNFPGSTH